MTSSGSALTVSQLNMYVKMMFESDARLQKICIVGEISNFVNHYKTGHCYFSLKDDSSAVKAVMFAGNASRLKFVPENGMRVFVTGRVSVYDRDGVYQIYVNDMQPEGAGALMIAFEQLKAKLAAEGLFDDELKKEIPEFPRKIGVITSAAGAAVKDIINVLSRRYPLAEMVFCPAAVQGVNCASDNIGALNALNKRKDIDVIILGRGGGSVEDLWGYNDEKLVRAVATSHIPVITGIGHETDFTLCDFASDLRAPTPSAAAELAVPDIEELYEWTDTLTIRSDNAVMSYFSDCEMKAENIGARLKLLDPKLQLSMNEEKLNALKIRQISAVNVILSTLEHNLNNRIATLKLLNPLEILKKGYAVVNNGKVRIASVGEISNGDNISVRFTDGIAECTVNNIVKN